MFKIITKLLTALEAEFPATKGRASITLSPTPGKLRITVWFEGANWPVDCDVGDLDFLSACLCSEAKTPDEALDARVAEIVGMFSILIKQNNSVMALHGKLVPVGKGSS